MEQAVIFDMDGVIIDTEHIHSKAYEDILTEYGVTAEKNQHGVVHISGATTAETWEILKARHGFEADTEELTRKKRGAVIAALKRGIPPLPGVFELLKDLHKHGMLLAVATSAQRERANLVLDSLAIRHYFTAVVTANDIKRGKPAPDAYLKAAALLHVSPKQCVVIEDAEVGVQAGVSAGMKVVAVPNEYTKRMNFSQATLVVDSLKALNHQMLADL